MLTLLPASSTLDDPVSATLRIVSLDDEPGFEALSYVWGDEEDTRDVIVNGHTTKVTMNLEAALRRLRESTPRVLWVDVLCINQNDITEKNHQVPFMAQLYTTCQRTIMWLGEGSSFVEALFQWVNSMEFEETANASTSSTTTFERPGAEEAFIGWLEFFKLPYWQRMWTFQEMILPVNDPICVYGSHRSPFSTIIGADMSPLIAESHDWHPSTAEHVDPDLPILECAKIAANAIMLRRHEKNRRPYLEFYLRCSIGRASKDPRDRIFALYGLRPDIQQMYPAEYSDDHRPLDRVLIETTAYLLMYDRGFMWLFKDFRMRPNRFSEATLPSWVPDYNVAAGTSFHHLKCAKSLQRRSIDCPMPATRIRDTAPMIGIPGIHVRSRQEPVHTAVPADLYMEGDIILLVLLRERKIDSASSPVERTQLVLLPGAENDLYKAIEASQHEVPADVPLHLGALTHVLLGDKPTLRFAGRYIGTCVNAHTFETDKALNAIILRDKFKPVPPQGLSNRLGLMLVELMRTYRSKSVGVFTIEDFRAACEVAMSPAPSRSNKFVQWFKKVFQRKMERGTPSLEADDEECMTHLFYKLILDYSAGTITKKLFTLGGEPALVGIGEEDIQDGDIIITPIDKDESGIPLILRKVRSGDSFAAREQPLNQQTQMDEEGTVYYKLVGPAMIPALSEETELVSRLAQRRVKDFFIQ